jgi:hypothetical protein
MSGRDSDTRAAIARRISGTARRIEDSNLVAM